MLRSVSSPFFSFYMDVAYQALSLPSPSTVYKFPRLNQALSVPTGFTTLPSSGWMAALVRCTDVIGTNRVICTLHSGSTANTFGMRYGSTNNKLNSYIRANSSSITGAESNYRYTKDCIDPAVMTWSISGGNMTIKLFFQGTVTSSTFTNPSFSASFTEFRIGARNDGGDPLGGSINYVELGSGTYLTDSQMAALAFRMSPSFAIAPVGQSNIQKTLLNSAQTSLPVGRDAMLPLLNGSSGLPMEILPTAVSGSATLKSAAPSGDPENYWWNDETGSPGPNLISWFNIVSASEFVPALVLFDQGEAETSKIDHPSYPGVTKATYKAGVLSVFNWIRNRFPTIKFGICPLGIRTDGTYTNTYRGLQQIVDAHNEIIAENTWAFFCYSRYDLALSDGVHLSDAAIATAAVRLAASVNTFNGATISSGVYGPQLASATRSTVTVTVTLTHDAGTDFTPTIGISGFVFVRNSDGVVFTPTAAVRATATTVTLTLASDPGSAGRVYYVYDNEALTLANVLRDNTTNTLPMRRGFVTCN